MEVRLATSPVQLTTLAPSDEGCLQALPSPAVAAAAGLRVTAAVSRKTALVVAADPYSQSGKAGTARRLGIRMVTEHVFLDLLNHDQQDTPAAISAAAQ